MSGIEGFTDLLRTTLYFAVCCTALCGTASRRCLRERRHPSRSCHGHFAIGRSRPVRPGRMDMRRGESARSDVSTSHVVVFGERHPHNLLHRTRNITTSVERSCHWTRMRHCALGNCPRPHYGQSRSWWTTSLILPCLSLQQGQGMILCGRRRLPSANRACHEWYNRC
jgi:hypothetical protein